MLDYVEHFESNKFHYDTWFYVGTSNRDPLQMALIKETKPKSYHYPSGIADDLIALVDDFHPKRGFTFSVEKD